LSRLINSKLKTIGEIIREQREKKGLLLRQLAALTEMDTAILSKIERGDRRATKIQITKFAHILKLDERELMIQFISEKIAYELQDEEVANEVLKVAEKKVQYLKTKL
jgi:HTH-type transcriptional regulator, competence development regulator